MEVDKAIHLKVKVCYVIKMQKLDLKYFIKKNSLFIDIGSGEMMDVSKKYTEYQIGFDTNSTLEDCRKEKMLEVISEYYNKALIPSNYLYQRQKVYSISHVLEHIEEPFNTTF